MLYVQKHPAQPDLSFFLFSFKSDDHLPTLLILFPLRFTEYKMQKELAKHQSCKHTMKSER